MTKTDGPDAVKISGSISQHLCNYERKAGAPFQHRLIVRKIVLLAEPSHI